MSKPQVEYVEVDGVNLRVATQHGKAGLPLLLFNGIGANLELCFPFMEALPEREIVITESSAYAGTNRYGAFHPPSSVTDDLLPPLNVDLLEAVYDVPPGGEGFSPMPIQDNYLVRKPPT